MHLQWLSPSDGFQRRSFLSFRLHFPYWTATISQLTHYSNWLIPRLAAISHQPSTLLTAVSRLPRNRSSCSSYNLGTDRTENTSPNSSSTVASISYHTDHVENTTSLEQICHNMPQYIQYVYNSISMDFVAFTDCTWKLNSIQTSLSFWLCTFACYFS
jgi:hypothetical protein